MRNASAQTPSLSGNENTSTAKQETDETGPFLSTNRGST